MTRMRILCARSAAFAVALLLADCGGGSTPSKSVCSPGASVACACASGGDGAQVCKSDGSGYEACSCGGGSSTGSAGATGSAGSAGSGTTPDSMFIGTWTGVNVMTTASSCSGGIPNQTLVTTVKGSWADGVSGGLVWVGANCTFQATVSGNTATVNSGATCSDTYPATGEVDAYTYSSLSWTLTSPTEATLASSGTIQITVNGEAATCSFSQGGTIMKISN
jgi:hypothetical protein